VHGRGKDRWKRVKWREEKVLFERRKLDGGEPGSMGEGKIDEKDSKGEKKRAL
jgi:hypothetical protein